MSFGRRRPQNRKERRRKTSRGQKRRSEGAGRDLWIALGAFAVLALLGILVVIYLSG